MIFQMHFLIMEYAQIVTIAVMDVQTQQLFVLLVLLGTKILQPHQHVYLHVQLILLILGLNAYHVPQGVQLVQEQHQTVKVVLPDLSFKERPVNQHVMMGSLLMDKSVQHVMHHVNLAVQLPVLVFLAHPLNFCLNQHA